MHLQNIKASSKPKTNYKFLLFTHLLVIFMVVSLFYTLSQTPFLSMDKKCFQLLNSWVKESSFWQTFWAMANHRMADWLEDVCFVVFFFFVIKSSPKGERLRKTAECIFCLLLCVASILLANELIFRVLLNVHRKSPTLLIDTFTNLSTKVTWLKVKFKSPKSFPADHATTALLFVASFLYLARKNIRLTLLAVFYGIFLCLPRLIAGAHWVSDVIVGSGSITIIFFSWAFCTPIASTCIQKIEILLRSGFSIFAKKRMLSDA